MIAVIAKGLIGGALWAVITRSELFLDLPHVFAESFDTADTPGRSRMCLESPVAG